MNKKGDVVQIVVVLIIIFIAALVGLICLKLTNEVNHYWLTSGLLNSTQTGTDTINQMNQVAPTITDLTVFLLFLGCIIGVCIAAVKTKFSATMLFLFFLLIITTILIASGLVNIYSGFADAMPTEQAQLTLTGIIFSRYTPLMMCIIGGIVLLLMYGKQGQDIVQ